MKIAFFGHSSFGEGAKYKERIITTIEGIVENEPVDFYLGNYGEFDIKLDKILHRVYN